jgi:hypothetical protein
LKELFDFLNTPFGGALAVWLFSSVARALPEPIPSGSRWYLFLYNLAHALLANWDKVSNRGAASDARKQP